VFEVFNDIYFVVYNLYCVGQNDDLGAHAGPVHRDGGSTKVSHQNLLTHKLDNSYKDIYDTHSLIL
jgi:hypothetical protein